MTKTFKFKTFVPTSVNQSQSTAEPETDHDGGYYEPSNFKVPGIDDKEIWTPKDKERRVTISLDAKDCDGSCSDKANNSIDEEEEERLELERINKWRKNTNATRKSRYSMFISGIEQFDPYQELTPMQILAFRQVFDLVDKDGGGSIDAEELYSTLKELDTNLNVSEIKEILDELDRDGKGEIDFEEFLYMMTSMSLQIKEAHEDAHQVHANSSRKKEVNRHFFSVITKFAMKHSSKEIGKYYASKTKYIGPHVVGHYAAGARVEGLSEKELRKTWMSLSQANKGKDSPYAQPLNFMMSQRSADTATPRSPGDRFKGALLAATAALKSGMSTGMYSGLRSRSGSVSAPSHRRSPVSPSRKFSTSRQASPTFKTESITGWTPRHRLPITQSGLPVVPNEKRGKLTIEDMSRIRVKVNSARHSYYDKLMSEKEANAREYYEALKVEEIQSKRLQENFIKSFAAYDPTNEYERGSRKYENTTAKNHCGTNIINRYTALTPLQKVRRTILRSY